MIKSNRGKKYSSLCQTHADMGKKAAKKSGSVTRGEKTKGA